VFKGACPQTDCPPRIYPIAINQGIDNDTDYPVRNIQWSITSTPKLHRQ
jgi:hypothetical protein